jgi:hypothetical protein
MTFDMRVVASAATCAQAPGTWMRCNADNATFQFSPDFGKDVIADFVPHGSGSSGDTIDLRARRAENALR